MIRALWCVEKDDLSNNMSTGMLFSANHVRLLLDLQRGQSLAGVEEFSRGAEGGRVNEGLL